MNKPPDQYRAEIVGRQVVERLAAHLDARFGGTELAGGVTVATPDTHIVSVRIIYNEAEPDRAVLVVDTFYPNAVALYVEAYCNGWRHSQDPHARPGDAGYGDKPGGGPPGDFPEEYPAP
jgi:hypothetical protein